MKAKLAQKATNNSSEEAVLLKAFKFFDINNSGDLCPEEFAKAIEKIGIMIPTRQVSFILLFKWEGCFLFEVSVWRIRSNYFAERVFT